MVATSAATAGGSAGGSGGGWAAGLSSASGFANVFEGMAGNVWGAKEARKSRKFQKKLMKKKYQWAVNDLRAAGLNPILAAGVNPGMGGSAMGPGHPMGGFDAKKMVEVFRDVKSMAADLEKRKQSAGKEGMLAAEAEEHSRLLRIQQDQARASTAHQAALARKTRAEAYVTELGFPAAEHEAKVDSSAFGRAMRWTKRLTDQIPPLGVGAMIQRGAKKPRRSRTTQQRRPGVTRTWKEEY